MAPFRKDHMPFGRKVIREAFDNSLRRQLMSALADEYPYQTKALGSDGIITQDGGVVILSKWPLLKRDEFLFGDECYKTFEDCMGDKGVKYVKVLKGKRPYHLFATHLQAGTSEKARQIRLNQVSLLKHFYEMKSIAKNEPVLFSGDFNIDQSHPVKLKHD